MAELQQELTRTKQELKDAWRESEASWVERDSAQTRVKNAEVEVLSLKRKLGRLATPALHIIPAAHPKRHPNMRMSAQERRFCGGQTEAEPV